MTCKEENHSHLQGDCTAFETVDFCSRNHSRPPGELPEERNIMTKKEEIKTIKERTLKLKLSDADCESISKKAACAGLSVSELLENFIGDLISGTYSNGSDERMKAREWFDRCWFGMFPETTGLLGWLSNNWEYDIDFIKCVMEDIALTKEEIEEIKKHPEEYDEEELKNQEEELEYYTKRLDEVKAAFLKDNEGADWEQELEKVAAWQQETEQFIDGEQD